jgi:DNA-binding transcriptional LysR family regulator
MMPAQGDNRHIRFAHGPALPIYRDMDLLLHFRAFVRVAELGGFSAAARAMGASQPAISRQVADLETRLGARLLHRSSTGVALTEEGRTFLGQARLALDTAEAAIGAVGAQRGEIAGEVRLGAPLAFGRRYVVPLLATLLEQHPALSVDLVLADTFGDLVVEALDATIRIGTITDPNLVVRRLGMARRIVLASPDYLARAGTPQHPDELAQHECLRFSQLSTGDTWHFEGPEGPLQVAINGRFRANTSDALRNAVLAGMGIFVAPIWLFAADLLAGHVVQILEPWVAPSTPVQLAFSSRRQVPPRVRAVTDHLAAEFRNEPTLADFGAL